MEYAYSLYGGVAPVIKKYQANETLANAGIVVLSPTTADAGVQISTTTSFANAVGVTLNTATYVTAQQSDGTSAERLVDVIVSPMSVYRALMSGGATEGTALATHSITTASTDGLTLTTGTAWNSPTYDEGVAWGISGANVGQKRKITSVGATSATVTVAFDYDTAVGDTFARAPYWYWDDTAKTLQTTTNLYQADASIAVGTGGAVRIVDLELQTTSDSYVHFILNDMVATQTT